MALRATSMALRRTAASGSNAPRAFSAMAESPAGDVVQAVDKQTVGKPLGRYQWDDPLMMSGALSPAMS